MLASQRTLHVAAAKLQGSNLSVTSDYIQKCLCNIVELDHRYGFYGGRFEKFTPKHICIEYSSPNIAKKFHAGHLRSTFVGQAISNILEAPGNKVTRLNYLGDWGMQFALLTVGFEKYGSLPLLNENPIKHLHDVYVSANQNRDKDDTMELARQMFRNMEYNDSKSLKFWKYCRDISLGQLNELYKKMNVDFDCYDSEWTYLDETRTLLSDIVKRGVAQKFSDNSIGLNINASSWHQLDKMSERKPAMLARSDGTSLYLSRDVAAAISRQKKFEFDKMYYVTDMSQADHFVQLFAVLELLQYRWADRNADILKHVGFGRVIGMKTRTGESIFADDILKEALHLVKEDRHKHATRRRDISNEEDVIRNLALSGLVCADLKSKITKDYRFTWSRVLDSKGDTGIFMQYTHSRMQNLKKNCGFDISLDVDCSLLMTEPSAMDLFQQLLKYNDICWMAYTELQPSYLTNYMFQLAHSIAKAHRNLKVRNEDASIALPRLLLFHCAQITLRNCMCVLGIRPLDNM